MNGYNFSERVRKVLAMAREQAAALQHEYVGTEHILLGLLEEGEGVGATVLRQLGVKLPELSRRLLAIIKPGRAGQIGPDLPYTSRAKKVLELSMSEARQLNHSYVGTEHLLLGLIAEGKGIAAQVLVDVGVTLDKARHTTIHTLSKSPGLGARSMPAPTPPAGERPSQILITLRYSNGAMSIGSFESAQDAVGYIKQHDVKA